MNKSIFAFFSVTVLTAAIAADCIVVNTDEAFASRGTAEGKVVMIIADYLDIEDINRMDFLRRLAAKSHVALMNNRQPGRAGASKSKLIIGSGKRLELNDNMNLGGSEESFSKLYSVESGRRPLTGSPVYTDIYKVKNRNADSEYLNYIGYIGDIINKNNGIVCFIGNADAADKNRSSMLIAMDSNGEVDSGETGNIYINDELYPYGIRTDYNKLAELYKQYLPASSFMVIETGDMERLEAFKASMSEGSYEFYKNNVLKNIDSFMKEIVSHSGYKTLVFISTYPSKSDAAASNRLTPVVVYEAGEEGVLYSSSTRREGIILNTDLADYLLFKLGYINNSAIEEHAMKKPVYFLEGMNRNIVKASALRAPVLAYYAVMVIVALGILFAAALFRKEAAYLWLSLRALIAYTMLSFPISFLYISASYPEVSPIEYTAFSTAASVFLSFLLHMAFKKKIKVMLSICLLLQIGLAADIFTGSPLIKQSVLGYDPVIGARFYGIGNEYAGIFIACSLMVFGCIQELRGKMFSRAFAAAYFLVCTCLLGLTFLGANFGGALAGAFGYLLAYFLVYDIKFNRRNVFISILVMGSTAAALIFADSLGISSQSHVGGLVKDSKANGFGVITSTIQRKISMNLRLIRYTIWTKVLLCIIAMISIMFYKPVKQIWYIFSRYKYLRYSWISMAVSAAAGFAVNDSGIVVAATVMIYAAFTMIIMCIDERNES